MNQQAYALMVAVLGFMPRLSHAIVDVYKNNDSQCSLQGEAYFVRNQTGSSTVANIKRVLRQGTKISETTTPYNLYENQTRFLGCSRRHAQSLEPYWEAEYWLVGRPGASGAPGAGARQSAGQAPTTSKPRTPKDRANDMFAQRDCKGLLAFVAEDAGRLRGTLARAIESGFDCVAEGLAKAYDLSSRDMQTSIVSAIGRSRMPSAKALEWTKRMLADGAQATSLARLYGDTCGADRRTWESIRHLADAEANFDNYPQARCGTTLRMTMQQRCPELVATLPYPSKGGASAVAVTLFDGEFSQGARACTDHGPEFVCSNPSPNPVVAKRFAAVNHPEARRWKVLIDVATNANRPITVNVNDAWVKQGVLNGVNTGGWGSMHRKLCVAGEMPGSALHASKQNTVVVSTNGVLPHLRAIVLLPAN